MISENGNTILAPVGLADICRVLRENTVDLGSLCRSRGINKWAKFKPVKMAELEFEDELNTTRDGWAKDSTWWRGTDGQCGIANIVLYSASQLKADTIADLFASNWTYDPPTGGTTCPYRAEDFLRYRHTALSPFGKLTAYPSPEGKYWQGSSVLRWQIELHTAEDDELSLTDIGRSIGGLEYSISQMWFGMLFLGIGSSNPKSTYTNGRLLLKTCSAALGDTRAELADRTVLELTTADTVEFASDLGNDTTEWIAYPILIQGVAVTSLQAMGTGYNLLFAPYKEAVIEQANPLKFLPSEYDVQSRFTGLGTVSGVDNGFYFTFQLSIVNHSDETKTVSELKDVTLRFKYSMDKEVPSASYWDSPYGTWTYTLNNALDRYITQVSETNVTGDRESLTKGWTLAPGQSATIEGRIQSSSALFKDIKHAQLSAVVTHSDGSSASQSASSQYSYWHAESDGYDTAATLTHTAKLEAVYTYLSGDQMIVRLRPTVTAKSGTDTTEWGVGVLSATVSVRGGDVSTNRPLLFPASSAGTWTNGVWTTSTDINVYLTPSHQYGDGTTECVEWQIWSKLEVEGSYGYKEVSGGTWTKN